MGRGFVCPDCAALIKPVDDLDAVIDVLGGGQEAFEIVLAVADVGVQRDIVDLALQPVEHRTVPADPVQRPDLKLLDPLAISLMELSARRMALAASSANFT